MIPVPKITNYGKFKMNAQDPYGYSYGVAVCGEFQNFGSIDINGSTYFSSCYYLRTVLFSFGGAITFLSSSSSISLSDGTLFIICNNFPRKHHFCSRL